MLVEFLNDYYQANLKSIHDVAGNQHLIGYSKVFKSPLFVKIFKERDMFYAEQHVNQVYYPEIYLDSVIFENRYVVTLKDREMKDISAQKLGRKRVYAFGRLLGDFHQKLTGKVTVHQSDKRLSEQIQYQVAQLQDTKYQMLVNDVHQTLGIDFEQADMEYAQLPKVVLHGDFSIRNIMHYKGRDILIDFERSHIGTPYQDFIKFFYNEVKEPALRNSFLQGYETMHPFEIPSKKVQRCLLFLCALDICEYNVTHPERKYGKMPNEMLVTIKADDAVLAL
ncbi:aminoglycoside phosphotransferase family protein [Liquorilactobacillus capillatus]|nr:aminoglycoside phosphotransferase family protein [Liquorilactobacillus capillatus]